MSDIEEYYRVCFRWLKERRNYLDEMIGQWTTERKCIEAWTHYIEKKRKFEEEIVPMYDNHMKANKKCLTNSK